MPICTAADGAIEITPTLMLRRPSAPAAGAADPVPDGEPPPQAVRSTAAATPTVAKVSLFITVHFLGVSYPAFGARAAANSVSGGPRIT